MVFQIPASVAEPLFISSARVTEWFPLAESETLEFRADVAASSGSDTFAILAWVPESEPVTAFAGYVIAKSESEIRVGKAIHRYFYQGALPAGVTNQNVTLVLSLSLTNGSVSLEAKVLDANAATLLFSRSFTDTPAADSLQSGSDSPPAPYLGRGRFVLSEYSELQPGGPDPRQIAFANPAVSSPAPAHFLPVIRDVSIPDRTSFFGTGIQNLVFEATSNEGWDTPGAVGFAWGNGIWGISLNYDPNDQSTLTVVAALDLETNSEYSFDLIASPVPGLSNYTAVHFDTFSTNNPVIEAEDYNFSGGQFIDEPVLTPEGANTEPDSYRGQTGLSGVDFSYRGIARSSRYRPGDALGTRLTVDYVRPKFIAAGGSVAGFEDYCVFGLGAGDYLNYTRTFVTNYYAVYLRESVVNLTQSTAALELVTSDPAQTNQSTRLAGYFLGRGSDFLFRNVPMTDASGNKLALRLGGVETLRVRQLSAVPGDAELSLNYLVFAPISLHPVLESAASVAGPYGTETGANLDEAAAAIRFPRPAQASRFYRLRAEVLLRITNVQVSSPTTLTLTFAPAQP